jgi:hypothetical protein
VDLRQMQADQRSWISQANRLYMSLIYDAKASILSFRLIDLRRALKAPAGVSMNGRSSSMKSLRKKTKLLVVE